MVNYRNFFGSLLFIFVFVSCKEETKVNTVEGFLYNDCTAPASGREVGFKANAEASFNEPIILATAVCNSSGYFRFTYELEEDKSGSADLIVVEDVGFTTALVDIPLNKDQDLDAYIVNQTPIHFTLTGTKVYQPTDTFYYGVQYGEEKFEVQPDSGYMGLLHSRLPNTIAPSRWVAFYYGIGSADFAKAKESIGIQDSVYNFRYLQVTGCDDSENFDLVIN